MAAFFIVLEHQSISFPEPAILLANAGIATSGPHSGQTTGHARDLSFSGERAISFPDPTCLLVSTGHHQDTELWNNQFPETKILGLPASRRMRGLV